MFKKTSVKITAVALVLVMLCQLVPTTVFAKKETKYNSDEYQVSGSNVIIDPEKYNGDTAQKRAEKAGSALFYALYHMRSGNGPGAGCTTIILKDDIYVNPSNFDMINNKQTRSVTIKGEKSGGGQVKITQGPSENYLFRFEDATLTLENIILDGAENKGIALFVDWDNLENEDEWEKYAGGAFWGCEASFYLKNSTIQNFKKSGPIGSSFGGGKGYNIRGGAAVMMFDDPQEGANNIEYHYTFSMDENSKILNCTDLSYEYYSAGGKGGNVIHIEGKRTEESMKVDLAGEISGSDQTAIYCKLAHVTISPTTHIHNCHSEKGNGGALQLIACGLKMSGGLIENCSAENGGAIYIDAGESNAYMGKYCYIGTHQFTGGTIQNCSAQYGGAIYIENYQIKNKLEQSTVLNDDYLYFAYDTENDTIATTGDKVIHVNLNGVNLLNNTATYNGGAVMNKKGFVVLNSGTVANNTAKNGGGFYKDFDANFFLYGGTVKDNTVTGEGKDIYLDTNKFSDCNYFVFKGNFEVGSPIFVSNNNYGAYVGSYDINRIIVAGKVEKPVYFDFQKVFNGSGQLYYLMSGYNLELGQENNRALTNMGINSNPYELTVEDFKNIVIVPVNSDSVNEYGTMFPIFIEHEKLTTEDNHHTIQGCRTTDSNTLIHISANGNDETGDGSIEKPVKTYAKAREIMGQKLIYSQTSTETVYFYRNSVAVIGSVTPDMGVPDEMLPMLWYTFERQNCFEYWSMGSYSREGKKVQLRLEDTTIPENSVNWIVLEGEITPTISETDFVFNMPATSVSLVADIGQVMYAKDIQLKLDVPDPDNVQETSFATIESVTVANYKGENEKKLSAQEIIDTFGSDTVNITWKKVEAGNFGLTKDEPYALFALDTSFIKNGGSGFAMPEDVKISVNGYESAVRVDSCEKCSVAHLVRRNNIPDLPTPEVLLTSSDDVQATNKGATNIISVTTNGIYEYTKPIKWKITEVRDDDDILQITDTEGYLPIGDNATASISKAIVSPNKIGHGEKTARIKITFEKEDGILNYEDMPDSITIDYTLAPGEAMPKVDAAINFTDETIEVTKGEELQDYVVEYMILEEGEYTKAKWNSSAVETLSSPTIDLDGYIANFGYTPNILYIRYRQIASDPGPGEINEVVIPTRPNTPALTVNYTAEKTNEAATYPLIYGTSPDQLTESASNDVIALTPGINMYFQQAATPISFASYIQELIVKPRPAAPVGIGINYYEEVTNKAIGEDIQYGSSEEILLTGETIGEGKAIPVTPESKLYFAYKATEEEFRSEIIMLEVPCRPATPSFTIDYKAEKTAEAIPSTVMYGTSEGAMDTVGTDSQLTLSPGTDVYFYKPATASEFKSDVQHLDVKSRREAPDVKGVNEDVWCKGDGKIKGLDAPNEYRILQSNGQWGAWINNGDDNNIKNLTTGTYEVRYSATNEDFISLSTTVEIGYGRTLTVEFDSNKGTDIQPQTGLKYNEKLTEPTPPEKTNCEFVEWCEDLLLLNTWDFDSDTVTDDMTLHAKWKRVKMDTPENLKWNDYKAKWKSVDDEDEYTVKLYKNGTHVETFTTSKSSFEMDDYLYEHGSGDYKFTVVAISRGIADSDVASSDQMTYYKPPIITSQPKDFETTEGQYVTFTVGAESDRNETLTYQWERLTTELVFPWKRFENGIEATYHVDHTSLTSGEYSYRCIITDEQGNYVVTNEVTLTVNKAPTVTISASATTVYTNDEVTLIANGIDGTGTLQYEWSDDNGSTTSEIKIKPDKTTKLSVTVIDERGVTCTDTVTITVNKRASELVYDQFVSIDKLLKSVTEEELTSGHVYYLMKSAVEGYEALSDSELSEFDQLIPDNNMSELYSEYADLIRQSDEFTEKVYAVTLDYTPSAKTDIDILEKEMAELLEKGVPISTSVSDEETGLMTVLKNKVSDTRAFEKEALSLVREILSQMSNDELTEYKNQMKEYMGEIPEPEKLPGFFTYLKQLFAGEAELDFWTYVKRAFESKTSAELREFKEALIEYLKTHENKKEMIDCTCEALAKAYKDKNNADVRSVTWAYNSLDADEQDMVAPVIKSLVSALYNKLTENVSADELKAIVFEEQVEDVYSDPSIESISELETYYNELTDNQKKCVTEEIIKKYEDLVADKDEAKKIADILAGVTSESLNEMIISSDSSATNVIDKYNALTDRQKTLIKEALGRRADNVIRSVRIIKTAKSLDKATMSEEEYGSNVLQIIKDMSALSKQAFDVMVTAFDGTAAYAEIMEWIKEHNFVCTASTGSTDITVSGLTKEAVDDIVHANNIQEITLQVSDNSLPSSSADELGKKNVFSVDTRLTVTIPDGNGGYEIKDVKLKKNVQVKMKIPNNYQPESLELWNVTDNSKIKLVDAEFIWNGTELYAVFQTKTFGQFILYARDITTTADIMIGGTVVTGTIGDISFDTYYNKAQTATITINDKGLDATNVQYYLTSSIYEYSSIKTISKWSWIDYTGEFALKTDSNNVVYVKITDELGNVTYAASTGVIVDTIAPSISGVTNRNYCTSPTMTVTETNLKSTTIDGKIVSLSGGKYSIPVGTHEIVVTDVAGNSAKVNVTVFDGHKASAWQDIDSDTHRKYCEGCGAQVNKEDHKFNQKVVASKHLKKAATYNDEGTYYKSCVCGRTDNTLIKGTFKGGGLKYDGVAPSVSISIKNETSKKIKYKVKMSDGESGMYRRYHYDAGAPMDLNGILKITGWERLILGIETFTIKKKNTKAVYIKAVDEQGNYTITDSTGKILYQYVHPK